MGNVEDAYRQLFSAIIVRSLTDLEQRKGEERSASRFLHSDFCMEMCDVLEIPYSKVLAAAMKKETRRKKDGDV